MQIELISYEALHQAVESDIVDSPQRSACRNLIDAINDWPLPNLSEPVDFLKELHNEIGEPLNFACVKAYCLKVNVATDSWKSEACASIYLLSLYDPLKTLDEIVIELSEFYLGRFDTWKEKVIEKLIEYPKHSIASVNNYRELASLYFDLQTYSTVVSLIEKEDLESVKLLKQEKPAFVENLVLVMFEDHDGKNCLASIYDNDELWQDPEIIDVFILQ